MLEEAERGARVATERATMRAVVMEQYGPPDVLQEVEIPRPVPGPGEALVRLKACAVNAFDLMVREGSYRANERFPHILGCDMAGTVEQYGPECTEKLPVGSHVVPYWIRSCGRCETCLRGYPTTCLEYRYMGAHLLGGYAEYVVIPELYLIPIGDFGDWLQAAAFPTAFGTSWHMLVTRAQLSPGETVLVQAVGSGIGMAALQIAQLAGAKVIASAGSDDKLSKARELGADEVVNYSEQDLYREVMRLTGKRGVDVVFEHIGGEMWGPAVRCATRNGRVVTCGGTAGYDVSMNIAHVFHKQLTILGATGVTLAEMIQLTPHLVSGRFRAYVDRSFPLAEAPAAHQYVADRKQFGKVVLAIDA
jgi:NADPH:quinone reductase-like Zn-dependent oxidoreductase